MVMNSREQLSLLRVQNAALEAKNAGLEERIKVLEERSEPKPPPRVPPPPAWAGSGENTGSGYCGPPTIAASGTNWVRERKPDGSWRDPFGQWRYESGELIPRTIEPPPVGPARDPQHQQAVELLDRIVGPSTSSGE
jgi:hypothetical protein